MTPEFNSESHEWDPTKKAYVEPDQSDSIGEAPGANFFTDGVYVRVSTLDQLHKGTSLDSQEAECIEAARRYGGRVAPEHIWRDAESGMSMKRDGLQRMLATVRNKGIQRLFFHVQDRLSREPFDTLRILDECEKAGVEVYSTEGPVDLSDTGKLMIYIKGYGSKQEHRAILERTQRGKWTVAAKNEWPDGNGTGLYGYDYDEEKRVRVVNEAQAAVVRQMFQWAFEGINVNQIAIKLNDEGIPTKKGKLWAANGVVRVLRNEAYTGVNRFGKTKVVRLADGTVEIVRRPLSETVVVTGFTPPIISRELFDAVQEKLNVGQSRRNKTGPAKLLTGLVKCLSCGYSVVGSMSNGGKTYYRCNAAVNHPHRPKTCDERLIRADWVESLVWEIVSGAVGDPDVIINEIRRSLLAGKGNLVPEIKKLEKEIEGLEGEQYRLLQQRQRAVIDQNLLERLIAPVKRLYDERRQELALLMEQQKMQKESADMEEVIRDCCGRIAEKLDNASFQEKRAVFSAFGVQVEATVRELVVKMTVDPAVLIDEQSRRQWSPRLWARGPG